MAGKYGRLCEANKAKYAEDVNFYYWNTSCCVSRIAKNLGIGEVSVDKLIGPKPEGIVTPSKHRVRG